MLLRVIASKTGFVQNFNKEALELAFYSNMPLLPLLSQPCPGPSQSLPFMLVSFCQLDTKLESSGKKD